MPIFRFVSVSQEQVKLSIFQIMYPEINIAIQIISTIYLSSFNPNMNNHT